MGKRGPGIRYKIPKQELIEMIEADMTGQEIADHYGCSLRTVQIRKRKYGLVRQHKLNLDEEAICRMYKLGATHREIADHFKISLTSVGDVTRKHGLTRPNCKRVGEFLGDRSPVWSGGVRVINGYLRVRQPGGEKAVHRLVAKHIMGYDLSDENHVHHMDENRMNNAPANLLVCRDTSEHMKLHAAMRQHPGLDQRAWIREYRRAHGLPGIPRRSTPTTTDRDERGGAET